MALALMTATLTACAHSGAVPKLHYPSIPADIKTCFDRIVPAPKRGAMDKAKGAVKDAAGKVTNDKNLQAEGKMDKAKGEARMAVGDVKDAVKRAKS